MFPWTKRKRTLRNLRSPFLLFLTAITANGIVQLPLTIMFLAPLPCFYWIANAKSCFVQIPFLKWMHGWIGIWHKGINRKITNETLTASKCQPKSYFGETFILKKKIISSMKGCCKSGSIACLQNPISIH